MNRSHFARPMGTFALTVAAISILATGCATKKFVRTELDRSITESEAKTAERMQAVEQDIEENQSAISGNQSAISQQGTRIDETSKTASDALDRAVAAGKLAEGTLISETVLTNDAVGFAFEKAELSDEGKAAIAEFAKPLVTDNTGVYIEIQGHTDSTGADDYNDQLGLRRAEAVRRYLNSEHGFPLHRMSVISYGEREPAYDNSTREGRAKNRRVVLVVLK